MHTEAYAYVARVLKDRPVGRTEEVVEIGGRQINGSIRPLFGSQYTAIDIMAGEGVDVVASGATYRHPVPIDVAVCCEVLEHTAEHGAIIRNISEQLAPGGRFILTAAGPTRAPHSAIDGCDLRNGEYYGNLTPSVLHDLCAKAGLSAVITMGRAGQDVWAVATKPGQAKSVEPVNEAALRILLVHPGASMSTADVHTGLSDGLKKLGHTVYDYALDARIEVSGGFLTYCWKKGGKTLPQPKAADIIYHAGEELVARALRVEPDVVLVVSAMYLHPDILVLMRRAGLRVAILFTESPYDDEPQAKLMPWVDLAWTNERSSARLLGAKYLPHAWHGAIHAEQNGTSDAAAHDVVFVGTGFYERIETLEAIDWTGIDFGLYGAWDHLGSRHRLRKYLREGYIANSHAALLYRQAKIGLNLYRTSKGFGKGAPRITSSESLNPRAYELAATGCFTISDARPEVAEIFGELVPTFSTPQEATDLLRHWLKDDVGRMRVRAHLPQAVAGQTWEARSRQVIRDLAGAGIVARREPYQSMRQVREGVSA